MKSKNREIYFFIEEYNEIKPAIFSEKFHQWKNTLTYMNKFTISENDAFEIAGIEKILNPTTFWLPVTTEDDHHLSNQKIVVGRRRKAFECLRNASGVVHLFMSGMFVYTNSDTTKGRKMFDECYVNLENIIKECLSAIDFVNMDKLRISIMELQAGRQTTPSSGLKLHVSEVDQYYLRRVNRRVSLNDQLDIFYENCLRDSVKNEIVYIFHTPLLTPDEFAIFQTNFVGRQDLNLSRIMDYYLLNKKRFDPNIFSEKKICENHTFKIKLFETHEYRLFIGYRATIELKFGDSEANLSKEMKSMQNKLAFSRIWFKY